MSENPSVPVFDVDQAFPLLTSDSARRPSGAGASGQDQTSSVESVLRDVLGWRPRAQDPAAFTAALTASFGLKLVEGHVETTYQPRGFSMQADLGAVTGGQASLYARARTATQQATQLVDGLSPLRTDADPEDCSAYRTLVRDGLVTLVSELGSPGGPRLAVVDSAFDMLAGAQPDAGTVVDGDTVRGQLGALRDLFGLDDVNVNTVEEERIRTSFWTVVDLVLDLRRSWIDTRGSFYSPAGRGFLGTDLVHISRLLAAGAEQVDELEAVLDSVLVTAGERQTSYVDPAQGLTLDGLVQWLRVFLTHDGPRIARDTGRDGMLSAFTPTAMRLATAVSTLSSAIGPPPLADPSGLHYIPVDCGQQLPPGCSATRVRIAVASLCRIMQTLTTRASRIGRYPGVLLFEVEISRLDAVVDDRRSGDDPTTALFRLEFRGANLRDTYVPALLQDPGDDPGRDLLVPLEGSVSANGDSLTGVFRLTVDGEGQLGGVERGTADVLGRLDYQGWSLVPAFLLPVVILDSTTGRAVLTPEPSDWPARTSAASAVLAARERRAHDVDGSRGPWHAYDGVRTAGGFDTTFTPRPDAD